MNWRKDGCIVTGSTLELRPASADEADELTGLMVSSVGHWGHDVNFPALVADLAENNAVTPNYMERGEVWVLVDDLGETIGFYGLVPREEDVDLTYMFLEPNTIGGGFGRRLWLHAVTRARSMLLPRMRIMSDPGAIGFYSAMGAQLERRIEVVPGFALGLMWFDLDQAS